MHTLPYRDDGSGHLNCFNSAFAIFDAEYSSWGIVIIKDREGSVPTGKTMKDLIKGPAPTRNTPKGRCNNTGIVARI